MTNGMQITIGWGLALGVSALAMVGLPKLAQTTSSLKEQAHWQTKVNEFQKAEARIATLPTSTSTLAEQLAEAYLDPLIENNFVRDRKLTQIKIPSGFDLIEQSKEFGRQKQCLSEAIYYEARSERHAGQKAVAEVILNRVKSKNFPNTICGVVYQGAERTTGCQFSFSCDGSTAKLPYGGSWKRSAKVADLMLMGASAPMTRRATHYHTTSVAPKWAKYLRQTRQYDTHVFYRFLPRAIQRQNVSVAP